MDGLDEAEVLMLFLLCQGYTAAQVAAEMQVSDRTVKRFKEMLRKRAGQHG